MNINEAQNIASICSGLTGKVVDDKLILNVIITPAIRDRTQEIIDLFVAERYEAIEVINNQYEYFEVLALYYDSSVKEGHSPYRVTPIEQMLNKVFADLPRK